MRLKHLLSWLLLSLMGFAIGLTFTACGSDDEDDNETVIEIDDNGKANGDHTFIQIDDNNFYIDDIKYTADKGELSVTGYNKAFFKGEAKIIDALDYQGHHLQVTSVGEYAFFQCEALTSVTIPPTIKEFKKGSFWQCTNLKAVHISDLKAWCSISFATTFSSNDGFRYETYNPLSTAHNLYLNGKEIKHLEIPEGVTEISDCAFNEFSGLTSVSLPKSLTRIGYGAFSYCDNLTAVHITDLASWCGIEFLSNPLTSAHHLYMNNKEVTELVIPEGVASINLNVFSLCPAITSLVIPSSATNIEGRPVLQNLTSIAVKEGNPVYDSRDNCNAIIKTKTNELILACSYAKIPNGVTVIGYAAFSGCAGLTSITIPESVTSIGMGAFSGCIGLTSITIPNNVTGIDRSAFSACSNLTSVNIGNGVTNISWGAFNRCNNLSTIIIGKNVTSIEDHSFGYCSGIKDFYCYSEIVPTTSSYTFENVNLHSATLHVPTTSINAYKTKTPWSRFGNIVPIE